jgi:hypothetical protein
MNPSSGVEEPGLGLHPTLSNDLRLIPTITQSHVQRTTTSGTMQHDNRVEPTAGRPKVRKLLEKIANSLGNAAHQKLDVSDYKDQKAHRYPEVPGEIFRNADLERIEKQYTELREKNSRAESNYAISINSTSGLEGSSVSPHASPHLESSPSRMPKRRDTLEVPTPVHIHRRAGSH